MAKYSLEFKLSVVQYYLSGKGGQKKAAKEFGLNRTTIRNWLRIYEKLGVKGLDPNNKVFYPHEFKFNVLKYMYENNISPENVAEKFNISNSYLIKCWDRNYNGIGFKRFFNSKDNDQRPNILNDITQSILENDPPVLSLTNAQLIAEVQYLRAENAYLKKLEALIQQKELSQK